MLIHRECTHLRERWQWSCNWFKLGVGWSAFGPSAPDQHPSCQGPNPVALAGNVSRLKRHGKTQWSLSSTCSTARVWTCTATPLILPLRRSKHTLSCIDITRKVELCDLPATSNKIQVRCNMLFRKKSNQAVLYEYVSLFGLHSW